MATTLTAPEKAELDRKGYYVTDKGVPCVHNYRRLFDPRKDEKGHVMGWTEPLPCDMRRLNNYLAHGFLLNDPAGSKPPSPIRKTYVTPIPHPNEIRQVSHETTLQCPLCGRDFESKDALLSHMPLHKGRPLKSKRKNGHKKKEV